MYIETRGGNGGKYIVSSGGATLLRCGFAKAEAVEQALKRQKRKSSGDIHTACSVDLLGYLVTGSF